MVKFGVEFTPKEGLSDMEKMEVLNSSYMASYYLIEQLLDAISEGPFPALKKADTLITVDGKLHIDLSEMNWGTNDTPPPASKKAYAVYRVLQSVDGSKLHLYRGKATWGPYPKTTGGVEALTRRITMNLAEQLGLIQ